MERSVPLPVAMLPCSNPTRHVRAAFTTRRIAALALILSTVLTAAVACDAGSPASDEAPPGEDHDAAAATPRDEDVRVVLGGEPGSSTRDAGGGAGDGARDGDAPTRPLGAPRLYVGSADGNIRVYAFDVTTHVLDLVGTTPAGNNPSFLAVSPDRRMVFAVDESIPGKLTSFTVDPVTGKLKNLQSGFGSGGSRPAHLSVDRAGRALLVAHHTSGTVRVFPRGKNGGLLVPSDFRSFGASAETHQIVTDPSNAFVLVPNSGLDSVSVFRLLDGGFLADRT